jgi:hypothetical protein
MPISRIGELLPKELITAGISKILHSHKRLKTWELKNLLEE